MPSTCRRNLWLVLLIGVAGCTVDVGLGGDETPARIYWLAPPEIAFAVAAGRIEVTAVPGLDTDRMLALDADNRLVPYAGARWNGPIPQLVASLADRTLGGSRGERAVALEVRRFFVECDALECAAAGAGVATVELAAWYSGDGAAPQVFVARVPLAESRLGAVAAAFQQAVDEVLTSLAEWLVETP
jgi:ABC-type uncharacterized transport system auxiliary subunit